MVEIEDGMPPWGAHPVGPVVILSSIQRSIWHSIWTAAAAGQIEMARQHLSRGIGINAKDPAFFGLTPLSIAAGAGQSAMVKFLLRQGADI